MSKTILIVDDSPTIRSALQEVLMENDYTVLTAENGKIAVETIKTSKDIGLVFMDVNMPEMPGIEALE
jgi:CheY-like chemotaxis protein